MKTLALAAALVLVPAVASAQATGPGYAPAAPAAEPAAAPAPAPAASTASGSGGYVALAIGLVVNTGNQLKDWDGGKLGTLWVGQKLSMFGLSFLGVEAGLTYYNLQAPSGEDSTNIGLAAGARVQYPVTPKIAPYVRLGIEKTWLSRKQGADFDGTGWLASVGVEYKLDFGFTSGGVFADITRHSTDFVNDTQERDGNVDSLSIGITAGF